MTDGDKVRMGVEPRKRASRRDEMTGTFPIGDSYFCDHWWADLRTWIGASRKSRPKTS